MRQKMRGCFWIVLVVLIIQVAVPQAAWAGPPLLCHPFRIEGAPSLDWGGSAWHAAKQNYNLNQLAEETLSLLTPEMPVIVRMETLRRATVYAMQDERVANELRARLLARARGAEAKGTSDALAWFDAGYFVEVYKQAGLIRKRQITAGKLDGYAWVLKAIALRGGDAAMEFAAALITVHGHENLRHREHLRKAVAGASEGSLLARNLLHQSRRLLRRYASTLAELRAQMATAND